MLMIKDDESLDKLIANAEYEPQQIKDYIIDLQAEYEELKCEYSIVVTGNKKIQERNNKALEYINTHDLYIEVVDYDYEENPETTMIRDDIAKEDLSKILKGENYEETIN